MVEFGVFGAPRFSVQRPQNTYFKGFWDLRTENRGAPKTPNSTTTDPTPHSRPSELRTRDRLEIFDSFLESRRVALNFSSFLRSCGARLAIPWAAANGGVTHGGLRGVWPPFQETCRNRPFSPFFCLFRPFLEGAKSTWEIQKTEEKGRFPQISSDLLKTHLLNPHLRHSKYPCARA